MKKIAFILTQFPETHETFILREFIEIEKASIPFEIFSIKPCRDKIIHDEAKPLIQEKTSYLPFLLSWCNLFAALKAMLHHPLKMLSLFFTIIAGCWKSPVVLIKSLSIIPVSCFLAETFQSTGFSYIHAHWATVPTTCAWIIHRLTGIRFGFTAHAWDIFVDQSLLSRKIDEAELVITCTAYNKKFLSGLTADSQKNKIHVIYHGIIPDKFNPGRESKKEPVILAIGRLDETKGFEYLIKACNILREKGKLFECLIVGGIGPLQNQLQKLIVSLGLESSVKLAGGKTLPEILSLYEQASVLAVPSVIARSGDRDGIPNVIIEAMAMELPVVASSISGIPEIVDDGDNGYLVPSNNEHALAEKSTILLTDDKLRKIMGEKGRKKVLLDFDARLNTKKIITLLKTITG